MYPKTICIFPGCGEDVEGSLILRHGWMGYDVGGFAGIRHRHNTQDFIDSRERNRKARPAKVEKAIERLLLHPDDEGAIQTLREWRAGKLFDLSTSGGQAGVRAATRLIEEFIGDEPKKPGPNQDGRATQVERPEIIVHVLDEPEQPRYQSPVYKDPDKANPYDPREDEEGFEEAPTQLEDSGKRTQLVDANGLILPIPGAILFGPDGSNWGRGMTEEELARLRRPRSPWAIRRWSG